MELNEQTELTSKPEPDSEMKNRRQLLGWGSLGSGGTEQNGKRTHGHGQQCGDFWEERGIRGLNDNRLNIIMIIYLKNKPNSSSS